MNNQDKYLVSACLAGFGCRYDGKDNAHPYIEELIKEGRAIPVCPEQLGGLPTPRACAEQVGERVINQEGLDVTEAFVIGAKKCGEIAERYGCKKAILKAKSPSCGKGFIYDGSFSKILKEGNGKTTEYLMRCGMTVITELDINLSEKEWWEEKIIIILGIKAQIIGINKRVGKYVDKSYEL